MQPGYVVAVREKSAKQDRILSAMHIAEKRGFADWLEVDSAKLSGEFKRIPERIDLSPDINESLVVELYSK